MHFKSNKYKVFCTLHFISTTLSTFGLSMSIYELAKHHDEPWVYLNYITAGCITTSLLINSIKDSLLSNPKIWLSDEELEKYQSPI